MRSQRIPKNLHGRYDSNGRNCEAPGCEEEGEFRAPGSRGPGFDGPGDWRYFCLDHVREFNAGYDFFENMSAEEILAAQSPVSGWQTETRAFRADAGADGLPRWADFTDPLDAIGGHIRRRAGTRQGARQETSRFTLKEHEALSVMGLSPGSDRTRLRQRYSELVRRYHPDRNGGDRSHERRLQRVVEAYQLLRRADAFS
ncbi:DnaJ domain-containing protein [Alteraurantiacibacter aestuarii]|uniref:J domain-containing protein n=1 Tax=Alteraurantiacibacter aestuarii TaxID=650004 RepID=UPI0031E44921